MPLVWILGLAFAAGLLIAEEMDRMSAGRTVGEEAAAIGSSIVEFIKRQEGFSATAYADAGHTAIGYGHDITGQETTTDPDQLLAGDVEIASAAVDHLVRVPLTDNQRVALVSFVYNIGRGAFAGSTLLRLLNAYQYERAADQFDLWTHATVNGIKVVNADLVKRRAEEKALFLS